jgi:hypothetical protein
MTADKALTPTMNTASNQLKPCEDVQTGSGARGAIIAPPLPTTPRLGNDREAWRLQACDPRLLFRPAWQGYSPGEIVAAQVYNLSGIPLGTERLQIESSPGSGFAGQVYRAFPLDGTFLLGEPIAIKVLRPSSALKTAVRDILFRLSFQTSYAPRLRPEAVRMGLAWQEILRLAATIEWGETEAVVRPLGYYWDEHIQSFVALHAWVDGRSARFCADENLIERLAGRDSHAPESEMLVKKRFMEALANLCRRLGALGLARQYEWYTFVSQANVLQRLETHEGQAQIPAPSNAYAQFTGIDWQPGLAVPFFLPLSPVHARMIWQGLLLGRLTLFDEVDFRRLDAYLADHPSQFVPLRPLVAQLKADDASYRSGLPDCWQAPFRRVRDPLRGRMLRRGLAADWHRLEFISVEDAHRLESSAARFDLYLLLDNLPWIGHWLMRLLGSQRFRLHLTRLFRDRGYLRLSLAADRAQSALEWVTSGHISSSRAVVLAQCTSLYLFDRLFLAWMPAGIHRFCTDRHTRRSLLESLILHPLRLCLNRGYRQAWLLRVVQKQASLGVISFEQAEALSAQVGEARLQTFVRDLGFSLSLELLSKSLYGLLAVYGLSSGDFLPLGIAALGPIPPSGIVRGFYTLGQLLADLPEILRDSDQRLLYTRLLGVLAAPWRFVGNLFAPLEMFTYYNDMSLLLGEYIVERMLAAIPVFGGRDRLLAWWAFNLAYNLPLSLRRTIAGWLERKNT